MGECLQITATNNTLRVPARPPPPAALQWQALARAATARLQQWGAQRTARVALNEAVLAEHTAIEQRVREARCAV